MEKESKCLIKEPLALARAACDTMMRKYKAEELPPKGRFHYHQRVPKKYRRWFLA